MIVVTAEERLLVHDSLIVLLHERREWYRARMKETKASFDRGCFHTYDVLLREIEAMHAEAREEGTRHG